MRIPALCILLALPFLSLAQTPISGVINDYAEVTAIAGCPGTITVDDATPFAAGDVAIIIQMQGATINESNSSSYGNLSNIGNAGYYERCVIASVSGNDIVLANLLQNNYTIAGKVQLVRVAQYTDVDVVGTVTAQPWNGTTGGIIALEASGTITQNADISCKGQGFRGAANTEGASNNCLWTQDWQWYWIDPSSNPPGEDWHSSLKGEGIAIVSPGKERGRGKQANGGGGGNDHNSGGGGGSNVGAGGLGGENDDPGFFTCHGYRPGIGGLGLGTYNGQMFMGGGGGSGHGNNGTASAGANGGGIIYIAAAQIDGNNYLIDVSGEDAASSFGDGAGGGGGGGAIIADIPVALSSTNFRAMGGNGGDADGFGQSRCFGPGGGGGGGIVSFIPGGFMSTGVSGGQPGVVFNSTASCDGSSNGAQPGSAGIPFGTLTMSTSNAVPSLNILTQPANQAQCPGGSVLLHAQASGNSVTYQWQVNTGSGWMNLQDTGIVSNSGTPQLSLAGITSGMSGYQYRAVISDPCVPDTATTSATLTVFSTPAAATQPVDQTVCNGTGVTFDFITTGGASTYQWEVNTGSGWQALQDTGIVSNSTTAQLDLSSVSAGMDGWQYRCVVGSGCPGTLTSDPATLALIVAPIISDQPEGDTLCSNDPYTFDFVLSDPSGMSFQWQINDGSGWMNLQDTGNVSNSTTASLTLNPVGSNAATAQYRCVASSTCFADIISAAATFDLPPAPTISQQPIDVAGCVGFPATYAVDVADSTVTYQWQVDNGSGWQNMTNSATVSGAQTDEMSIMVANGMETWQFQCLVISTCGNNIISQAAGMTVGDPPSILSQPTDQVVCEGATTSLFFGVSDLSLDFQWQMDNGSGFMDLSNGSDFSGVNFNTLAITNADGSLNFSQYRCEIEACGTTLITDTVTLLVVPDPNASFTYTIFGDSVAFFNNSTSATQFSWNFGDSTGTDSSLHTSHVYAANGIYIVSLTATSTSCGSNDTLVAVQVTGVGLEEATAGQISTWPIPASTELQINLGNTVNDWEQLSVFNAMGQEVYRKALIGQNRQLQIEVDAWPAGTYYFRLAGDERTFSRPFVVAH